MNLHQPLFFLALALPGFAIAFLIGVYRARFKPDYLKITLWAALAGAVSSALICGSLAAAFLYMMRDNLIDHHQPPLTVAEARAFNCPIPLPDSARKVQFVIDSGGMQALEILVRFESPVDVCRAHVQTVTNAWSKHYQERGAQGQLMGSGEPPHPLPLTRLNKAPMPEDHDMAGRARWFDVEHIENGYTTGNELEADYAIQFWIDEDRGVFYCKITD